VQCGPTPGWSVVSRSRRPMTIVSLAVGTFLALSCRSTVFTPGPSEPSTAKRFDAQPAAAPVGDTSRRSPSFIKTEDSDAWVRGVFSIQQDYARVLLVTGGKPPLDHVDVSPLELNRRRGRAAPRALAVTRVFATLQDAADAADGGDLVAVMPGAYAG